MSELSRGRPANILWAGRSRPGRTIRRTKPTGQANGPDHTATVPLATVGSRHRCPFSLSVFVVRFCVLVTAAPSVRTVAEKAARTGADETAHGQKTSTPLSTFRATVCNGQSSTKWRAPTQRAPDMPQCTCCGAETEQALPITVRSIAGNAPKLRTRVCHEPGRTGGSGSGFWEGPTGLWAGPDGTIINFFPCAATYFFNISISAFELTLPRWSIQPKRLSGKRHVLIMLLEQSHKETEKVVAD